MTNLTRYEDPFSPLWGLTNLQREVDSLFEDFRRPSNRRPESWTPSCDVQETEGHFLLNFDVPGVNKDDIQIDIKDNQLFVRGERKVEHTENQGTRHFSERIYGTFSRAFTLPTSIDSDKIEASYSDGVLHISVPKAESAKPRRIQIGNNSGSVFKKILGSKQEDKTVKAV